MNILKLPRAKILQNKPGTCMSLYLQKKGFLAHEGCSCQAIAKEMDDAGSKSVLRELHRWTNLVMQSASNWKRYEKGLLKKFVVTAIPRCGYQLLIKESCEATMLNESSSKEC